MMPKIPNTRGKGSKASDKTREIKQLNIARTREKTPELQEKTNKVETPNIPSFNQNLEIPSTSEQGFELLVGIRYFKLPKIPSNIDKDVESPDKTSKVEMPTVTTGKKGSKAPEETIEGQEFCPYCKTNVIDLCPDCLERLEQNRECPSGRCRMMSCKNYFHLHCHEDFLDCMNKNGISNNPLNCINCQ